VPTINFVCSIPPTPANQTLSWLAFFAFLFCFFMFHKEKVSMHFSQTETVFVLVLQCGHFPSDFGPKLFFSTFNQSSIFPLIKNYSPFANFIKYFKLRLFLFNNNLALFNFPFQLLLLVFPSQAQHLFGNAFWNGRVIVFFVVNFYCCCFRKPGHAKTLCTIKYKHNSYIGETLNYK